MDGFTYLVIIIITIIKVLSPKYTRTLHEKAINAFSSYCHCIQSCHCCCLHMCPLSAHVCCLFRFCPTQTLLRTRDGEYKAIHCEGRLSRAEVDPWLACHGYLLPITSFAAWKLPSNEALTA